MNAPHSHRSHAAPRHGPLRLTIALAVLAGASPLLADVVVDAVVTPLGGSFRYDITITNNELDDLAIVSFADAPGNDPLIGPSLIVPLGYVGSYDGVLQFLDFLSDTAPFLAGGTVGGFRFESLSGPGLFFTQIEALTVNGDPVSGIVNTAIVPEPGTVGAALALGGIVGAYGFRRARRTPPTT